MQILSHFPEKEYYPYQKDSILSIFDNFNNGSEIVFFEGPWGIGKSVIAKTFASYFKKTYVLTATKGLQNQYLNKYPDMKRAFGRSNSKCLTEPDKNCAKAKCSTEKTPCAHKPKRSNNHLEYDFPKLCDYWKMKVTAIEAQTSCHNYDYLLTEINHVGDFIYPRSPAGTSDLSQMSLGIFDEAHNIGIKILKHFSISINKIFLASVGIPLPNYTDNKDEWINWLDRIKTADIPANLSNLQNRLKSPDVTRIEREQLPPKIEKLEEFSQKINFLLKNYAYNKEIWLFIPKTDNYNNTLSLKILPVIVSPFVEDTLFKYFDKKLLMSSTILNPYIMINDLGLKGRKMNYVSVPCPFPLENRPIYPLNIGRLGYEELSLNFPKIVKAIELILDIFPDKKGLIHSGSFNLNNNILDALPTKNSDRIVTHLGDKYAKTYQDAIAEHIEADYPSVLMTPSAIEGVDLPGKQSEFQICIKLSYENIQDNPQLKIRQQIDPEYIEWGVCVREIQRTGRSIRNMQDIAPTFYLDSRLAWFLKKNSILLPYWWRQAIQNVPHKYTFISEQVNK